MTGKTQAETRRSQYLLGLSSEAERERFESEYFADEDAFQEMLTAEDDLIDAYVRGELSAKERKQFEKRFLTSSQARERVQFARTLVGSRPVQTTRGFGGSTWPGFFALLTGRSAAVRIGVSMAVLAVIVGFSWLLVERARMRIELRELRAERAQLNEKAAELQRTVDAERAHTAETMAQLKDLRERSTTVQPGNSSQVQQVKQKDQVASRRSAGPRVSRHGSVAGERRDQSKTVLDGIDVINPSGDRFEDRQITILSPGNTRGGGRNTIRIPFNATFIGLQLALDTTPSHENYNAVIETAEGRPVWRRESFNPFTNQSLLTGSDILRIPAKDLPAGDYILLLTGKRPDGTFERVAEYSFRVVKN